MKKTKIFIADDHPVVRKGIKAVFSGHPEYAVVGEADDGLSALRVIEALRPDIALLDISMPELDGITVARRVCKDFPGIKVIIFSMYKDRRYEIDAFRSGAMGYILKGGEPEEILFAVKRVLQGKKFVSQEIAEEALDGYVENLKRDKEYEPFDSLTLREREILKLITTGSTNKVIAEKLFISVSTVKSHRLNIMRKLNIKDITGLFKVAYHKKIIDPD